MPCVIEPNLSRKAMSDVATHTGSPLVFVAAPLV